MRIGNIYPELAIEKESATMVGIWQRLGGGWRSRKALEWRPGKVSGVLGVGQLKLAN